MKKMIVLFIILLPIFLTLSCNNKNMNHKFLESSMEIQDKLKNNSYSTGYKDFLEVVIKPTDLLFNKTTVDQHKDEDVSSIVYNVRFKNITQRNIKINLKLFIPNELGEKIIYGERTFGPKKSDTILKPNEVIDIDFGTLMKHYDKLSEEEKELFEKYKDTIYFEVKIDDQVYYGKAKV